MKNSFFERLIPHKYKIVPEDYIKAKLLVKIQVLSILFAIVFGAMYYHIEYHNGVLSLGILATIISASLVLFFLGAPLILSANLMIFGGYLGFLLFIIYSGGVNSPTGVWLIAVSLSSFLVANRTFGYMWLLISLSTLFTFFILHVFNIDFPDTCPPKWRFLHNNITNFGLSLFIAILVILFENIVRKQNTVLTKVLEDVEAKNRLLQSHEADLETQNLEIVKQKQALDTQTRHLEETIRELEINSELMEDINAKLEKLSIVADKTDNVVVIMDPNGNIEWVNKAFTHIYGLSHKELIRTKGRNILQVSTYPEIEQTLSACLSQKHSITFESQGPTQADGKEIWFQTTLTPVFGNASVILKLVAIETDITKIKEYELEIKQQKEEILVQNEELIQYQEELLAQADNLLEANNRIRFSEHKLQEAHENLIKKSKQITDSIHYAKRLQMAILPTENLIGRLLPQNFIFYLPRDIVSGDFYWIRQKNQRIYIAVADCTGHGVPGAFMSMLGFAFINEIINESDKNVRPDEILNKLRQHVVKALRQRGKIGEAQDGMDISMCILNFDNRTIQFAGANSPLYMVRRAESTPFDSSQISLLTPIADSVSVEYKQYQAITENGYELIEIKGDNMPIGIYVNEGSFVTHEIPIRKGDTFYMFSDGFVSQFGGEKGRKILSKNFKKILLEVQEKPMNKQKEELQKYWDNWIGELEQIDDVLVFGYRI
jgi:PAS domain S-box-containing protein